MVPNPKGALRNLKPRSEGRASFPVDVPTAGRSSAYPDRTLLWKLRLVGGGREFLGSPMEEFANLALRGEESSQLSPEVSRGSEGGVALKVYDRILRPCGADVYGGT